MMQRGFWKVALLVVAAGALAACGGNSSARERAADSATADAAIGVNSFLWRASLDTLNFMPLASADPFGGVIITDWYSDTAVAPNERFKATVYILDTRLRADALNVSIFKQVHNAAGWQEVSPDPATAIQIENAILRRARELRLSTIQDEDN